MPYTPTLTRGTASRHRPKAPRDGQRFLVEAVTGPYRARILRSKSFPERARVVDADLGCNVMHIKAAAERAGDTPSVPVLHAILALSSPVAAGRFSWQVTQIRDSDGRYSWRLTPAGCGKLSPAARHALTRKLPDTAGAAGRVARELVTLSGMYRDAATPGSLTLLKAAFNH